MSQSVDNQTNFSLTNNRQTKSLVFGGIIILVSVSMNACVVGTKKSAEDDQDQVSVMRYSVREAGREKEFLSETLVSKYRLVMWEPGVKRDFLMFDREKRTIYSVNSEDKSIFVIKPKPVATKPPVPVEYEEQSQPSAAMPKVQNMSATHYRYTANGKHCYDVVSLPVEFLPEVRKALAEYRKVLAGEHAAGLKNMPSDVMEACDLALNIFHPTRHLNHGLPIREWDRKGNQKFMVDYRVKWKVDMSQFDLPDDYKHFSVY